MIKEKIKKEMDAQGIGVSRLATEAKFQYSALKKYLYGSRSVKAETLERIFEVLGIEFKD